MKLVTLTFDEAMSASFIGVTRLVECLRNGRKHRHGAYGRDPTDFQWHVLGAMGEAAVAKHLGMFWLGKGEVGSPDVGANIQVRATEGVGPRSLIIHEDDKGPFYLARRLGESFQFEVYGPVDADACKVPQYWRADRPHPAYFVPASEL